MANVTPSDRAAWVINLNADCYTKAVLHVLAHRANASTYKCFITVNRLAMESGMSSRRVQVTLRNLEAAGLLKIDRSPGRKANTYALNMKANHAHPAPLDRAQRAPLRVVNRAQNVTQPCTTGISTVHSMHPEQVLTSKEQPAPAAPSVWDLGKQWISGELLGKCIKVHGADVVAQAIAVTDLKRPADPKSYLLGVLKKNTQPEVRRVGNDY